MQFNIPSGPDIKTLTLSDFLGADFTSMVPDKRRSPNLRNVINNNGYIENRHGYTQVGNTLTGLKINGVWSVNATPDVFVVHAGTKLYELDVNFTNPIELFTGMADAMSEGLYLNNKLYIFDGTRAVVYYETVSGWTAAFLDTVGYIPTTTISRSPDGTGAVTYEDINLIQPYRINSFLPNGTSAVFTVDSTFDNEAPTATILNSNGTITSLTVQSFDKDAGTVTFASAPPVSPVTGRDSVFIKFKVTNSTNTSYINKCTVLTTYGYGGNNNRLFVAGNSSFPNIDWYSEIDDGTYFPSSNYTRIGFEPIIDYLRLNDGSLGVLKNTSETDATIYYRKSITYNGKEAFPIEYGVNSVGCISKYCNANLLNDPITLCNLGVFGIKGSAYKEKFANERSYFVNKKLLAESNLANAVGIVYKDKYYLAVNSHVYIADSNYKVKLNNNSDFEYEWYYWTNVPVRVWFIYNEELYFGTSDGKIMKFSNAYLDVATPVDAYYDSGFLDCGSITETKTGKQFTVITRPDVTTKLTLGYELDNGSVTIITKEYSTDTFPKVLQEKEKTEKFMFIRVFVSNNTNTKMSFYKIAMDFVYSGRYRGE